MLEAWYLTKSKVRRELLGILFSNPQRGYYLSELARLVGTSAGNIQRELSRFLRDELVRRNKKGPLTLYLVNPDHALFPELQSLILKTTGVEGKLKELVQGVRQILCAILYGSFAKGEERGESDIDLLVVSDEDLGDFYRAMTSLETLFGREINPTVYSSKEFRKGIRQREGFMAHLLREPHRILKGNLRDYEIGYPRRAKGKP